MVDIAEAAPTPAPPRQRLSRDLRRLFKMIIPVNIAIYLVIGAVPGVLLPLQVQAIDEAHKAGNLALITGLGALAAMIASPIAGWSPTAPAAGSAAARRGSWAAALALGLSLVGMGFANGVAQMIIAWVIVQVVLNFVISPVTAILPDRVPQAVRGTFATLSGIGLMLGAIGGQVLGAALSTNIRAAYLILPA
jgi:MFS family permease